MSASATDKAVSTNAAALQALISLENEALEAADLITLQHIAVNRPRALIQTGHIFWIRRRGTKVKIEAISSQSNLDKTTPFIQWMTRQLNLRAGRGQLDVLNPWEFDNSSNDNPFTYPFTQALYAPLAPNPQRGGLLFTPDHPFKEVDHHLAKRLTKIFGMAASVAKRKKRPTVSFNKRLASWGAAGLLALIAAIPVPMTTLAPAEIIASKPYIITAPFDGVIEDILVPPNMPIDKDTPILRFEDMAYRNDFIIAGKEDAIAEAKLQQAGGASFINDTDKPDIAIAKAEKALATARQTYAKERLAKTVIHSPQKGLAIYSDPADWRGRHVTTGEVIIQIADPAEVRLRIEAPLSMGESLKNGARVKLFLDNSPLNAFEAELTSASYYAKPLPNSHMAYEAYADLQLLGNESLPRIGARGVAKIYGRKAALGYWLFRRPITLLRQSLGV